MKYNIRQQVLIFLFLYFCLWISTILYLFVPISEIFIGACFETILIYFILLSRNNKIGFILALSTFIYFYQVPLMQFFPHDNLGVYNFALDSYMKFKAYSVYNIVIGCIFVLLMYILNNFEIEKIIHSLKESFFLKYIFYSASLISLGLLIFTLYRIGGLTNYLMLNKFEASFIQKVFFFTYKDFALIAIFSGLILNNNKINLFTYLLIFLFSIFEILSAKRYILLVVGIGLVLFKFKKINYKSFFYIGIGILCMSFIKFTYYDIKNLFLHQGNLKDIFWFEWQEFFSKSFMIHEGRAHIELLLSYLYNKVDFNINYFIEQLLVSLPLGHHIVKDYSSAGEYLKVYLHEPWMGLGSSQYIIPYLSIGLLGIFLIYSLHLIILIIFNKLIYINNYFKLLFLINIPVLFFYSQREEVILITKNLIISSVSLGIVYIFAYFIYFLDIYYFKKRV